MYQELFLFINGKVQINNGKGEVGFGVSPINMIFVRCESVK